MAPVRLSFHLAGTIQQSVQTTEVLSETSSCGSSAHGCPLYCWCWSRHSRYKGYDILPAEGSVTPIISAESVDKKPQGLVKNVQAADRYEVA